MRCISIRSVGARRGRPYYAAGLYEARPRADGRGVTWRLIGDRSGCCDTHEGCLRGIRNPEGYPLVADVIDGQDAPDSLLCLLPDVGVVD